MPSTKRTATANPDSDPDLAEYQRAFKRLQTQVQALCHKVIALRNEVRALKRENASIPVATPVATPVAETSSSSSSPGQIVPCVIDVDVEPEPEPEPEHTRCNSVGGASSASCCTVRAQDTPVSE